MKIAYLFFAYKNPKLLSRVIERLSCEDCSFFIHIDRKRSLSDFSEICGPNVTFLEDRIPVYWGEYSGIEAILSLIRRSLADPKAHEYFVLMSGSEYPLKSKEYIHEFLEDNRGTEFMSMVRVPNREAGKPMSRISTVRFPSKRPILRFAGKVLAKLGLAQRDYRRYLGNLQPYAGHTWWALTRDACAYVSDFVKGNTRVARFFENTFAPEETLFQTILGNSAMKSRIQRNLIFEDWSARGAHPAMIGENHIGSLASQQAISLDDAYGRGEVLFARKFSDENLGVVDKLEQALEAHRMERDVVLRASA